MYIIENSSPVSTTATPNQWFIAEKLSGKEMYTGERYTGELSSRRFIKVEFSVVKFVYLFIFSIDLHLPYNFCRGVPRWGFSEGKLFGYLYILNNYILLYILTWQYLNKLGWWIFQITFVNLGTALSVFGWT